MVVPRRSQQNRTPRDWCEACEPRPGVALDSRVVQWASRRRKQGGPKMSSSIKKRPADGVPGHTGHRADRVQRRSVVVQLPGGRTFLLREAPKPSTNALPIEPARHRLWAHTQTTARPEPLAGLVPGHKLAHLTRREQSLTLPDFSPNGPPRALRPARQSLGNALNTQVKALDQALRRRCHVRRPSTRGHRSVEGQTLLICIGRGLG